MKKVLSLVLVLSIVLGSFGFAFAAPATEAQAGDVLKALGVLQGTNAAGDLNLAGELNRQDMIVLLSRLLGEEDTAKSFGLKPSFTDVTTAFYVPYIAWAEANGYTNGIGGGKFGFGDALTVQQTLTFLMRALGYTPEWNDVPALAVELELVANTNGMNATATRGKMAELTLQALFTPMNGEEVTLGTFLGYEGFELEEEEPVVEVPAELKVVSVSANNYKQVVIEFNALLDADTAEDVDNYSINNQVIYSAELLEDGMTVVLTLQEVGSTFAQQAKYELSVDGVMDATKALTIDVEDIEFTAVDVTLPTVAEVKALGTKALRIKFSEPVSKATALSLGNYKIDGKSIVGTVQYTYPNVVIISTNMTVGDKVLEVANVTDFGGFKVNQKDLAFVVAEDTTAPQIVSVKSIDLKKVEITFDEPVKSITRVYFNANTADTRDPNPVVKDNKVTASFNNAMSLGGVTIHAVDVEDYSGNKSTRTIDLVPTIDTTRPEVVKVDVKLDGGVHQFTITYSKDVMTTTTTSGARNGQNYVVKDSEGKVVTGKGLDHLGRPVVPVTAVGTSEKEFRFTLTDKLAAGTYTLEIQGVQDQATIGNTMLPTSVEFKVGDTTRPTVTAAWVENNTLITTSNPKKPAIYIQFSEEMATTGNGNVLDVTKYNYASTIGGSYLPFPTATTVELITDSVVKLTLPSRTTDFPVAQVRVALVADTAGNFILNLVQENISVTTGVVPIAINSAKATATDKIEVEFNGVLTTIDANDFELVNTASTAYGVSFESSSVKDGKTTVVFTINTKVGADGKIDGLTTTFRSKLAPHVTATQNGFGAVVIGSQPAQDKIRPSVTDLNSKAFELVYVGGEYAIEFKATEDLLLPNAKDVITVKFGSKTAVIGTVVAGADNTIVRVPLGITISDADGAIAVNGNTIIEVKVLTENDVMKYVKDGNNNAMNAFTRTSVLSSVAAASYHNQQTAIAIAAAKVTLQANITSAQALHDAASEGVAVGEYAVGSKATFQTAITAAGVVHADVAATLAQVNTAITDLAAARTAFEAGIVTTP